MQKNCGENEHGKRNFIISVREIFEIFDTRDILAHTKFWSFSTTERNSSRPQRVNEMTIPKQTLGINIRILGSDGWSSLTLWWPCEFLDRLKDPRRLPGVFLQLCYLYPFFLESSYADLKLHMLMKLLKYGVVRWME